MCKYLCGLLAWIPSSIDLGREYLAYMAILVFDSHRITIGIRSATSADILPGVDDGSSFATSLPAFAISVVTAIWNEMKWKLKVVFVLISPCLRI